jgi:hypothetical protein
MTWRTLSCVVELPVQGTMTESDFRWSLERAIRQEIIQADARGSRTRTGQLRVKSLRRVSASRLGAGVEI